MRSTPVPKNLDAKPRILFWDAETVLAAVALTGIGTVLGHAVTGALLGVAAGYALHRLLASRVRGFPLHLAYWHFGAGSYKRTPSSAKRRFVG